MIYAYLRVSTDEQDVNSQKIGVEDMARRHNLIIDKWVEDEGVSGAKPVSQRKLGVILKKLNENDILIVSEISRLARDFFMLVEIMKICRDKNVLIYCVKENLIARDDIQTKMIFCNLGLMAEWERRLIIQRTKEGLERAKNSGKTLGRPFGSTGKSKLDGKEDFILKLLKKDLNKIAIARKLKVDRETLRVFINKKALNGESERK